MLEFKEEVAKQLMSMVAQAKEIKDMTNSEYEKFLEDRVLDKMLTSDKGRKAITKGQEWYLDECIKVLDRAYFKKFFTKSVKRLEVEAMEVIEIDDLFDLLMDDD